MTRATPVFTATVIEAFEAGDFLRSPDILVYLLQNLEFLLQSHNHGGDGGDGGLLATADPKAIWFYGASATS